MQGFRMTFGGTVSLQRLVSSIGLNSTPMLHSPDKCTWGANMPCHRAKFTLAFLGVTPHPGKNIVLESLRYSKQLALGAPEGSAGGEGESSRCLELPIRGNFKVRSVGWKMTHVIGQVRTLWEASKGTTAIEQTKVNDSAADPPLSLEGDPTVCKKLLTHKVCGKTQASREWIIHGQIGRCETAEPARQNRHVLMLQVQKTFI